MKILCLVTKKDPGDSVRKYIDAVKSGNDTTVVDINADKNYGDIVDLIDQSDKVISL